VLVIIINQILDYVFNMPEVQLLQLQ